MTNGRILSSFRDPSGFLFYRDGILYRQINSIYKENYDTLINSGLFKSLLNEELIIPHEEVNIDFVELDKGHKIIKPELIEFISYPYEWCFSQLKAAALLTLKIEKIALNFGMSLKDCSAYNVQFRNGKPIFIDTLSFEVHREGRPWIAYRQFCQHFLAPLALMSQKDIRLNQLFRIYIDGIPLSLASSLLPLCTWFKPSLLLHIHLHAKSQKHFSDKTSKIMRHKIRRAGLIGLINFLESAIIRMKWTSHHSEWIDYYNKAHYSSEAMDHKKRVVSEFLDWINPRTVWDIGANLGMFSRIASNKGIKTIAFDNDPLVIENIYLECISKNEKRLFPLLLDLSNPSAGLGWSNIERMPLMKRGFADAVLALALVHHLAISNNLTFEKIAKFFSDICHTLIIEFVPKVDSQVQKILATREDVFSNYTQHNFEHDFENYFIIKASTNIKDSLRVLYLMENRSRIREEN